jgi:hypothetical protein
MGQLIATTCPKCGHNGPHELTFHDIQQTELGDTVDRVDVYRFKCRSCEVVTEDTEERTIDLAALRSQLLAYAEAQQHLHDVEFTPDTELGGTTIMSKLVNVVAPVAKAVAAAGAAFVGSLALYVTGDEGLGDVTVNEWLLVAGFVFAAFGVVWVVPNRRG